ncbi:MAG TPA: hypothetical protein P5079_06940 [Elusimicrobiota bacterium]|nr:hypothetical protein [Elusimicrobiota bacterium]
MWEAHRSCNYRCPYCFWDPHWGKQDDSRRPAGDWIGCWGRVEEKYGPLKISVVGGEPLIFPECDKLFQRLTARSFVALVSNLSPSLTSIDKLLAVVTRKNFMVTASFHPHFAVFDDFAAKARLLKDAGCLESILIVAYPPQLEDIQEPMRRLESMGIGVNIRTFKGEYGGRDYPACYTEEERSFLRPLLNQKSVSYNLEKRTTRGRLCYAGKYYAMVDSQGKVYRCGADAQNCLGNIFDPNFELLSAPARCPSEWCACRTFQYLVEEYDKLASSGGGPAKIK